ncbi:MAG TPA: hypothetical protein VFS78_21335 [Vicinamibacteria bacterium]|nr:hypothetical protein [Vicinamibacteria bacterium]
MRRLLSIVLCCGVAMAAGASDEGRENAVKRARQLVARELSTRVERIAVGSVEPAQWPDAALGCPVAGMQYAQVVTDGLRVRLSAAGREYEVHVAGQQVVLCPEASAPAKPEAGARALETARAAQAARRELAKRLGLALGDVKLATVREIDAKAGESCPPPGDPSGRAYDVQVTAGGRAYHYRARSGQAMSCPSDAGR